jgi:hypothetical protein
MADPPGDGAGTVGDPSGWEPLDPDDPLPDQDSVDLTGWGTYRTEVVIETLWRTDIDLTWDVTKDRLVFHAADRPAVMEVLDRFRDAPSHEIDEVLDRLWDEDEPEQEEAF